MCSGHFITEMQYVSVGTSVHVYDRNWIAPTNVSSFLILYLQTIIFYNEE